MIVQEILIIILFFYKLTPDSNESFSSNIDDDEQQQHISSSNITTNESDIIQHDDPSHSKNLLTSSSPSINTTDDFNDIFDSNINITSSKENTDESFSFNRDDDDILFDTKTNSNSSSKDESFSFTRDDNDDIYIDDDDIFNAKINNKINSSSSSSKDNTNESFSFDNKDDNDILSNDDEYIDDDDTDEYFEDDPFVVTSENKDDNKTSGNIFCFNKNNFSQQIPETLEAINTYLKYLNININIYNHNVTLYEKSALILENYFSFVFTSLYKCFDDNIKTLMEFNFNDTSKNIYRNYEPLLTYMRYIYKLYQEILFNKINEIEEYMLTTEKILMKHSWLLTQGIWACSHKFFLPVNHSIEYYENYELCNVFDNIRYKLERVFNFIYTHL